MRYKNPRFLCFVCSLCGCWILQSVRWDSACRGSTILDIYYWVAATPSWWMSARRVTVRTHAYWNASAVLCSSSPGCRNVPSPTTPKTRLQPASALTLKLTITKSSALPTDSETLIYNKRELLVFDIFIGNFANTANDNQNVAYLLR